MPNRIQWAEQAAVAANARHELPKLAAQFFEEVRDLLAKSPEPAQLHRLRVSGKRLRYALELFRPCYSRGLEERIEALRQLQDRLGEVSDAVAALRQIKASLRPSPQRTRLERFAAKRAAEKAQAFQKHWKSTFDAPGQYEWWTSYLARTARAPGKK